MRRRQITIDGGRYLIFYSFEDEQGLGAAPTPAARAARDDARREARDAGGDAYDAQPTREGERGVREVKPAAEGVRSV